MGVIAGKGLITTAHVEKFKSIVGDAYVLADEENLNHYGHDETEQLLFLPEVVLKPRTAEEIAAIMKICNQDRIPVTPRGAGTGLSGGALPHLGGVLLSTERMNSILSIDERNLQVITEPGVITEVLQNAVKEKGLFYPPDPSSRGSCFIGGNIAENSGGPKAVKYGVVKDYVLNLEVVLPNGEIIWTGANVLKNSTAILNVLKLYPTISIEVLRDVTSNSTSATAPKIPNEPIISSSDRSPCEVMEIVSTEPSGLTKTKDLIASFIIPFFKTPTPTFPEVTTKPPTQLDL